MNLSQKIAKNFACELCDYLSSNKYDFQKHVKTKKHKIRELATFSTNLATKIAKKSQEHNFHCENCYKTYKDKTGLWRHKKKCLKIINETTETYENEEFEKVLSDNELTDKEIIMKLLKQNNDFKDMLCEQNKALIEIATKNSSVISNSMINSHNKTFNLQVFLNETCKDAMNLMEFVDSLQLQLSDLENVGKNGFVKGISNIIVQNLKALDITKRPVHCSDYKREIMYVKEDNQWFNDTKETEENQKLKNAIKQIAHKNICMIPQWKAKFPDCVFSDSKKSDQYNHIIYESMDQNEINTEKIIKNIAKEVLIEKKM